MLRAITMLPDNRDRHLLFEAGADLCYPIMRLHFWSPWRKGGGKPLLRIQKIKQFQGFAAID